MCVECGNPRHVVDGGGLTEWGTETTDPEPLEVELPLGEWLNLHGVTEVRVGLYSQAIDGLTARSEYHDITSEPERGNYSHVTVKSLSVEDNIRFDVQGSVGTVDSHFVYALRADEKEPILLVFRPLDCGTVDLLEENYVDTRKA